MHNNMALLLNICKFNGCDQIFPNLEDLIHHIEKTHIVANEAQIPERSQPACLPLSCILPYNPPCESFAHLSGISGAANGTDTINQTTGSVTAPSSATVGTLSITISGGSANNQSSDLTSIPAPATSPVNGSSHGITEASVVGTTTGKNGLTAVPGTANELSKSHLNQTTGTADLKRKIAIKHHSYSISSSNRSTTPTGSEMDDDDMMVSESEDSNDSWTTEEFSSEFIMRYGSRRHSSSGTGNGNNSSNEKPFACPVPGCKKRYKNVNGIKYHSKNGHKKDGNRVRKGYKCFCGKSYKTNQRLKIHNMLSHGPGWTNPTIIGSSVASATPNGAATGPSLSASQGDVSVAAFETIPLSSSAALPAPAAANKTPKTRGSSSTSSTSVGSSNNSSLNFSSTWDSSYTIDFSPSDTSGINNNVSNEQQPVHEQMHEQANQASKAERSSCGSTCNSNSNSSSSSSGHSSANRSGSGVSSSSNSNLNTNAYPNSCHSVLHITTATLNTSSHNGTNASTTTSPSTPLPPPIPTLAPIPTSSQSGIANITQTVPKRTLSSTATTTTAAALMISPVQPSHGINSTVSYASSTPNSSPVSIKYDSLGILTPATSPKLLTASISPDNGQLLAGAGGSTTVAVLSPFPPPTAGSMATINVNVTGDGGGTAASGAATNGGPIGMALVVPSIGGCGEVNSNTNSTITTTNANNTAVALPASSATSQLYGDET